MNKNELLRSLPKVDEILKEEIMEEAIKKNSRGLILDCIRETVDWYRNNIVNGKINDISKETILKSIISNLNKKNDLHLKKVINATGIVIHTNLGRSVLCKESIKNVVKIAEGYSNLEYNLDKGMRGSRYDHVEELIKVLTGAEAAMVVNNNAAAVLLALNTLCKDKQAIVSRGELVEIGGSFRIPDVMSFSGAELIEVGTTNRTHLYDYENNINENTGILLRVHSSNFKIIGFTERVSLEELVKLGCKNNIPIIEDIGSGTLIDFSKYGFNYEPTVQNSIKKGVDIVTFSGDKMLGGPQAGIIVGKKVLIEKMKKNQLTRALRIDKMTLAALEGTLKMYLNEEKVVELIPTLYMLLTSKEIHKKRAGRLKRKLLKNLSNFSISLNEDYSMVGGGSMPEEKIETYVLKIRSDIYKSEEIEKRLRENIIPIITRINKDEVIIDLRTIKDEEFDIIVEGFKSIDKV
ncbi:L-seryl-tRNA(Sec) selenium transferase [Clostridium lundense]|uniref:L-seryl-tRNA(Sec) selenium transferase n=1 Tax=Clostridium lundense TaxID=319475 RepID=UPI00048A08A0|nr:L-seryl-tRNA(Sec) selenium transferase [Clostridium lundense]